MNENPENLTLSRIFTQDFPAKQSPFYARDSYDKKRLAMTTSALLTVFVQALINELLTNKLCR